MNKLAKILQLAETFYSRAMQALAAEPAYVMPDDPETSDENDPSAKVRKILDDIDNDQLGTQLERILEFYDEFVKSLNGPLPAKGENTPLDWRDGLRARLHELQSNKYLSLNEDDSDYTETFSPMEIEQAASALLDDADNKIEAKAKDAGLGQEDIEAARAAAAKAIGDSTAGEAVENKNEANQQKRFADEVQRQLDSQKKYLDSLKFAKKIGFKGLTEQAANLQEMIGKITDPDKKKQLEDQLALVIKQSESVRKHKEGLIRRHEAMKNDADRLSKHQKELVKRQSTRRQLDDIRFDLVDRAQKSTNPAEQAAIIKQLVTLEKQALIKKKYNLNSDEFRNDPELSKLIDPKYILEHQVGRKNRYARSKSSYHYDKEVAKRQSQRASGDLIGLLLSMTQQFSNPPNEVKKKIQKILAANGLTDPFFDPYKQELAAAEAAVEADPSPINQAALLAAQTKMSDAIPAYKNQHPLYVAVNSRLATGLELKKALQEVVNMQKKTSKPLSPWFYASEIPEDKKVLLQELVLKCQQVATSIAPVSSALADTFAQVAVKLQEKL